jgi:methylenetetrahydrofolate--tRNA-(uracil-5-)-methyltransferase
MWNLVGFQTRLRYPEQQRVFRMIPGLENAEFARLGGLHRNTYLDSPKLLDGTLRLKAAPRLRFAGQITGCEGYVESTAVGLMAALFASAERRGEELRLPPPTTALGALLAHITGGHLADEKASARSYQPMNINFGLFPPAEELKKPTGGKLRGSQRAISRKQAITSRAKADLETWLGKTKANANAA